ncbi:MAG: dipeptidase [Bryobacteraceae bacterium]|nr:dipeptidase [Bryobacteraceae bacterium]
MVRCAWLVCLVPATLLAQEGAGARFERLMTDLMVVDTHVDTPWYVVDEGYDVGVRHDYYEADIPRLREGHAGAVFFGLMATPESYAPHAWVERTLDLIDSVHEMARRYPDDLEVALTSGDIRRIRSQGRVAVLLSVEGGHQIDDNLRILRNYYRLGVRYMTLTHFKTNNWADSSTDAVVHGGLSPFGREVVREMNRLGMMVDISHVSPGTFDDAIETSRAPVIASHSSVRALCDTPRNMTDDEIRKLAAKGGVIFINFNVAYLDQKAWDAFRSFRDERDREIAAMMAARKDDPRRFELKRAIQRRYRQRLPPVDSKTALRHIDHVVRLAGADHVGIGSDFDGISGMAPAGLEDVSKYPALVRGMIEMGYSDGDIRKIMGENLLRVMKQVEEAAQ